MPARYADSDVVAECLEHMARDGQERLVLAGFVPSLRAAIADVPNPDRVLVAFERLAQSTPDRLTLFHSLATNPRDVEILVTLFSGSRFLTEILLRNPEYAQRLVGRRLIAQLKPVETLFAEVQATRAGRVTVAGQLEALLEFQRSELLRIGACDLLGMFDLSTVTGQLSALADSLVQACLDIAAGQSLTPTSGFAVIALGKLGGEELNYSSDIDLVFVAAADAPAYGRLAQRLIEALTQVTAVGSLYRVDMRLRPWGRDGALVSSLGGYASYLQQHARLWEKQALLKARAIAGDGSVAQEFLRRVESLLFDVAADRVRSDVHAMKERIEAHLRRNGREWGEVKLGEGSIRDVEFVVQYLQLAHGAEHPEIRSRGSLDSLERLLASGLLAPNEFRVLRDGYIFLRTVEHYLQVMDYRQTHSLPSDPGERFHLARRLGFRGPEAGSQLITRYEQHTTAIRAVYRRHLEARDMRTPSPSEPLTPVPGLDRHLARMDPSYAATFSSREIERHAEFAARLDDDNLVEIDVSPLDDGCWRLTIVAYDYLGELSVIGGLLFVHGFNIIDGEIFTYEPLLAGPQTSDRSQPHEPRPAIGPGPWYRAAGASRRRPASPQPDVQRKIVDVFTVHALLGNVLADTWSRYAGDLATLLRRLRRGEQQAVQGELAKRVAKALPDVPGPTTALYPISIEIDNTASDRYTVLRIDTPDTIGFLYEFTNALAVNSVHIARVTVETVGSRVQDTLYVTDVTGQKITAPETQRRLRAATALVKHFTHLLPHSPNPESALLHFREFIGQLFSRPDWPDELASLEHPEVLDGLARLLGVSNFLWEDFLRMQYDNLFPVVRDVGALALTKDRQELRTELAAALDADPERASDGSTLNAFKDREMLRIDMRYILGHVTDFGQFASELSDLAEVVVDAAYRLCNEKVRGQFGEPCLADGRPCSISVCGLGKCGGRELGFASDIELMLIFDGHGKTTGPQVITTAEFCEKIVQEILQMIRAKREGIFHIDLRLRPYGRAGSVAVSRDAFQRYFAPGGPAWPYERQALIKLRPVAGDPELGARVVAMRDQLVYTGEPFDVVAMRAMRERQIRQLVTPGTFNAKFSPGGAVDLEYLVQGLQITHGHANAALRSPNTREAMDALAAAGVLRAEDYMHLLDAHIFIRRLINALRMVRGNTRDLTVPLREGEELAFLARRLDYGHDVGRFRDDLTRHTTLVQDLSRRLLVP